MTRADAIAVIEDHRGHAAADGSILAATQRRFGWAMFTDEALAFMAERFEADAIFRERINAENRALHEAQDADRALTARAHEGGTEIVGRVGPFERSEAA